MEKSVMQVAAEAARFNGGADYRRETAAAAYDPSMGPPVAPVRGRFARPPSGYAPYDGGADDDDGPMTPEEEAAYRRYLESQGATFDWAGDVERSSSKKHVTGLREVRPCFVARALREVRRGDGRNGQARVAGSRSPPTRGRGCANRTWAPASTRDRKPRRTMSASTTKLTSGFAVSTRMRGTSRSASRRTRSVCPFWPGGRSPLPALSVCLSQAACASCHASSSDPEASTLRPFGKRTSFAGWGSRCRQQANGAWDVWGAT